MSFVFAQLLFLASATLDNTSLSNDSFGQLHSPMQLYQEIAWPTDRPVYNAFYAAMVGYQSLQDSLGVFQRNIVTIIDFSQPSNVKRLWVIDIEKKTVLLNTLVAHGRNSGEIMATRFSNKHESFQSSLGFYSTGHTYIGKHGLSLILHGLETGINDQAQSRSIVVHGAEYVNDQYIKLVGRLGRSQGCPAVPMAAHRELIRTIQNNTCLFIYAPAEEYARRSNVNKRTGERQYYVFQAENFLSKGRL